MRSEEQGKRKGLCTLKEYPPAPPEAPENNTEPLVPPAQVLSVVTFTTIAEKGQCKLTRKASKNVFKKDTYHQKILQL